MRRSDCRLTWCLVTFVLLGSCDPSTDPEPDYTYGGPCLSSAPSSGELGDVALSLEVVPSPVEYGIQFNRQLSIHNVGAEDISFGPQTEYCIKRVWVRGVEPVYDRVCVANSFYLAAGAQTIHGEAGEFRSTGPQFATASEPGVRAEPGTYCAGVLFRLAGDSLLLEKAFELVSQ